MSTHLLKEILHVLRAILHRLDAGASPSAQGGFTFSVGPTRPKETTTMPLDLTITTEQKVHVTANPVTAAGKPAKVDGPVTFTTVTGDVTIEASDATSATIVSGANGDSTVSVSADADLGAGVETITDTITVHVTDPKATSLGLVADAPVAK
jgi:hypothetical protein